MVKTRFFIRFEDTKRTGEQGRGASESETHGIVLRQVFKNHFSYPVCYSLFPSFGNTIYGLKVFASSKGMEQ
jgi:hypothetical protein